MAARKKTAKSAESVSSEKPAAKKTVKTASTAAPAKKTGVKESVAAVVPAEKKPAKAKKPPKKPAAVFSVRIDHPSTGEIISCRHYTVRISTTHSGNAEISVNGGSWLPCREAVGFRWFDWYPSASGQQRLRARVLDDNDAVVCESAEVRCELK